jgi:hypothetical protein
VTLARRKPAWSLQVREMVGHLGLRRQGSNPFSRSNDQLARRPDASAPGRFCFRSLIAFSSQRGDTGGRATPLPD